MNNSSELCRMPVAHVCWSGCDPVADEHYHPPSMKTEVEPRVHDCIVRVCQGCIDLKGQECHVPECVFCFKGMDEAKWLLDKMLICPIIDGKRYVLAGDAVEAEAVPSGPGSRLYSGDLWLDPDGTANFKFHIEGGDFTAARHALEKFITCLQDKLNRSEDCPYAERVLNHCDECGKDFHYSYEGNICPPCFQRTRNEKPNV